MAFRSHVRQQRRSHNANTCTTVPAATALDIVIHANQGNMYQEAGIVGGRETDVRRAFAQLKETLQVDATSGKQLSRCLLARYQ